MTIEWSLAAVHDVIAAAVPDKDMLVWNDRRRTYGEVRDRTRGLAGFLVAHGVGVQRERDELERWECGQTPVAVVMNNRPEYIESMLGGLPGPGRALQRQPELHPGRDRVAARHGRRRGGRSTSGPWARSSARRSARGRCC